MSKNPKRGCWNWKLSTGISWLTRDSTSSAGLFVRIAPGAGREISDNSGKPPEMSLYFRGLSWCRFHGLNALFCVYSSLLSTHLGTPE